MPFSSLYQTDKCVLSYELFPPKTEDGDSLLFENVQQLMKYHPDFITCTYGAGGSSQHRTLGLVKEIKKRFNVPVASHLTLVGSTTDQIRDYLQQALEAEIDAIVALRGDPPKGQAEFTTTPGGFSFANQLVDLVCCEFPNFGIAVAGYPEKHKESPTFESDLDYLKVKVDAGADVIVTQLFLNNEDFFRFRDRCELRGINIPIVPGIMPFSGLGQLKRIGQMCAAAVPESLIQKMSENDCKDWQFEVGVEYCASQVRELQEEGVAGLHFYVLNKSQATLKVLDQVSFEAVV